MHNLNIRPAVLLFEAIVRPVVIIQIVRVVRADRAQNLNSMGESRKLIQVGIGSATCPFSCSSFLPGLSVSTSKEWGDICNWLRIQRLRRINVRPSAAALSALCDFFVMPCNKFSTGFCTNELDVLVADHR